MNSNVICTNNFSFFVIEAIVNKWDFIKSVLSVKENYFQFGFPSSSYSFICRLPIFIWGH